MSPSYRLARLARSDLKEIGRYIAHDNPVAAARFIDRIRDRCAMLARQPLIGEVRDELRDDLRSFSVGSHVIYYEVDQGRVTILRVLHGARDVRKLL